MGRQVPSALRRRTSPYASLSPSPTRSSATDSSMDSVPPTADNLTPARKHHKLLKDGSEVWSKDVEKIFVEGLRQYWQSPWATYSRGRSRWRNQFLVDHLKKAGIERTKKQVASHIQVLRNMWRGQPEFHLVAGGEELFQENGLLAHTDNKSNAGSSKSASSSLSDLPDSSTASTSSSSTPEYITSEFPPDLAPPSSFPSFSPSAQLSSFPEMAAEDSFPSTISPLRISDHTEFVGMSSSPPTTHPITPAPVKLEPLAMDQTLFTLPQTSYPESHPDYTLSLPNRISNLFFWADGMVSLSIDIDRLLGTNPASPPRTFVHFRVSLPPIADLRCPQNFQGINGAVTFGSGWSSLAKCSTKSWGPGRSMVGSDLGLFTQVNTPDLQALSEVDASSAQMVYAYLPDSSLTRCHWLDPVHTITQQIAVDNVVLAVLVYHIERVADTTRTVPAMELMGLQKVPWRPPTATHPHPPASASSTSSNFSTLASPSPPLSPQSPTFATPSAYSHAPISPQSPMFARTSVPHPQVASDDLSSVAQLMYTYPPPLPFGYHHPH